MREKAPALWAHGVAAALVRDYMDSGQPYEAHGCGGPAECKDCNQRVGALKVIQARLERKAQA